eukprot:TRINITY_DN700_c1_g1_i4.p1 TRINITY_DN700_c1_g1~~TRINITY_DN700_c1_g1_i4.p1  ORF type:complete len:378 (-),score=88.88 TRINITY_DN700_c1_g1_i4:127-1260(-)
MSNSKTLFVTLLDDSKMKFEVTRKTLGIDILDQICEAKGIWERDYFSLQFINLRGEKRWFNNKNPLHPQLLEENIRSDNFNCQMRVKFFVPPQQLLITLTKHLFYLELKKRLHEETLTIPTHKELIRVLACVAQSEMGDFQPDCDLEILYRSIIPCYKESIFGDLKRQHAMLRLTTKTEAEVLLLSKLSQLTEYGEDTHEVYQHGQHVMSLIIGMGGVKVVMSGQTDRRIPFSNFISARVNNNLLHILVENFTRTQELELEPTESPIKVVSNTHHLSEVTVHFSSVDRCWHAYRSLTERIVFYDRQRADDIEVPHFKCRWHSFVAKIHPSRAQTLRLYNFDVARTSKETYDSTWNILATDVGERNASKKRVVSIVPF